MDCNHPDNAPSGTNTETLDNYADATRFANHASNAINLVTRWMVNLQKTIQAVDVRQQALTAGLALQHGQLASIDKQIKEIQQRSLEKADIEEARFNTLAKSQQEISLDANRRRLRTVAATLSAFCTHANRTFADAGDRDHARRMVEALATDLELDVFTPLIGQQFDPHTMEPPRSQRELGNPSSAVVEAVIAPGFRHVSALLGRAKVRLSQAEHRAMAADTPSPIPSGSERCLNHAGAVP